MWFRSANSHTGPQLLSLQQEAGQMAASDYASKLPQITACVYRGVHRWNADIKIGGVPSPRQSHPGLQPAFDEMTVTFLSGAANYAGTHNERRMR